VENIPSISYTLKYYIIDFGYVSHKLFPTLLKSLFGKSSSGLQYDASSFKLTRLLSFRNFSLNTTVSDVIEMQNCTDSFQISPLYVHFSLPGEANCCGGTQTFQQGYGS
jgi:hypothetical protein